MSALVNYPSLALRAGSQPVLPLVVLLLTTLLTTASASADVVLSLETTHHTESATHRESTRMEVAGRQLKMDITNPGSRSESIGLTTTPGLTTAPSLTTTPVHTMLFRGGDTPEIVVVRHQTKSYMVLDPNTIAALGSEMRVAMVEANAQINALPPEQRDIMRRMLDAQLGQARALTKPPPSTVLATSERKTIQGLPCRRYDVYRQGELIREVWAAPWNTTTGAREAFEALREMSDFYSGLMASFEQLAATGFGGGFTLDQHPFDDLEHMDGFPVFTRNFTRGGLTTEVALRSVEQQDLDPEGFLPPEGYRPTALPPR